MGEQCMRAGSGCFISLDRSKQEHGTKYCSRLPPSSLDLWKTLYTRVVCTDKFEVRWTQSFIGLA